jgi:glycosyltransferase involved in cell wall biosynthesis
MANSRPLKSAEKELSLVLPCYNEEEVVQITARELASAFEARGVDLEMILVDNGSTDTTGQQIDALIAEGLPIVKVHVPRNQGYGYGVLQGLRVCRGRLVGFVCSDGQVHAGDVVKVYDIAARARTPKLVKVRRRFRMDGLKRKIVSVAYNVITTVMFGGLGSIDVNGNPKIFPRQYLDEMNLQSRDWFLDAETLIRAKQLGLQVFEINVIAQLREGGRSNVRVETCWEFTRNLLHYRLGGTRLTAGALRGRPTVALPRVAEEGQSTRHHHDRT